MLNLLLRMGNEFSHRRVRPTGLSDTECKLCSYIGGHDGCSQDEAGQKLGIDKTTVTKALQALEDKGMVVRKTFDLDRRRKMLTLTEKGRQAIMGVAGLHEEWFARIFSCLNAEEQHTFEDCCRRLLDEAEKLKLNER